MNTVIREVVLIPQASNTECCKSEIHFKTTDLQNLKTNQMKLTLDQEQLARIKSLDSDKKRKEFFLTAIIENIIRESKEFISPEKEYKVKVEIVKDEKLKGTGYENSFFKVTIPIGTPIQDSLNAVDEFFKQKPVNFPSLTSREKAMYKIIEMRREFDKSANNNPKQFTLEDMRKIYVNGILDNQNLLVTPETSQITFDMHLRNIEKNLNYEN